MIQTGILNKFNQISKNIDLCNNPINGDFAFGILFKVDDFMLFYNDFKIVYEDCNFKLFSIKTDYAIKMVTVYIVVNDNANNIDRFKMATFLNWALEMEIIDFFN